MIAFIGILAAVLLLIALVYSYMKYLELNKIKDWKEIITVCVVRHISALIKTKRWLQYA